MSIPDPGGTLEERFLITEQIGSGAYGQVFKALEIATGKVYALKKVVTFDQNYALPLSFYRELNALQRFHHENILGYGGTVLSSKEQCPYIILDYCEYDLGALICSRGGWGLPVEYARSIMRQILTGLAEMHENGWAHLDLKPANILVDRNHRVHIGDFGLTRNLNEGKGGKIPMNVVTLAYRAPEIIFQDASYGCPVDIWSLACVFYEMATGRMLFASSGCVTEEMITMTIFNTLGTPDTSEWPQLGSMPKYQTTCKGMRRMEPKLGLFLTNTLPQEYAGLKDLMEMMLIYNPSKRITAREALNHPFFTGSDDEEPVKVMLPEGHQIRGIRFPVAPSVPKKMLTMARRLPPPICVF